jgi:glycosyltransferase involved in cell wall biosynthesis
VTKSLSKFRIGIDATNLRRGGGRTHLIELLRAADPQRDGFNSIVVWGATETLDLLVTAPWIEKISIPALNEGLVRRTLWQRFSLSQEATRAGCDVLFVPGGSFKGSFRPVVTMSRNMLPFEWHELRRFGFSLMTLKLILLRLTQTLSFRQADGVIFLTEYAKAGVLRVTGLLRGATDVIPHGVNPRFLASQDELDQRKLPDKDAPIRLIYVSIINQYKHQWHVVKGVAMARGQSGLDLRLDLVGPAYAPALQRLQAAIAKYDPDNDWVNYRGPVDYTKLHELYSEAHVGIFASSCENMPNILLETMAAGLPVISSDRGPMPEVLGDAGLYFDPESPGSLKTALLELLVSDEKMGLLGRFAYEKAKTYSWDRCAENTFAFLCQICPSSEASSRCVE